ncbi:hypothetical protein MCOR02_011689 [Pyricularia oryzae]|nr:hypothetical protein MCOR02_011689 [Pyricularia oryzae]KAI6308840.1 hypothetical protein MCOR34_007091 [Pyricularia oryzae]KAI6462146.1 hypothetical protein MCOR17_006014 [Pyricularia oryzae]KAI6491328.1 hypothetical protein MCOR13_008290 [Pyricularia oryzae]KAI6587670.1 hypothetical protein MCOR04_004302 [Pyricularia oryzae]
MSSPMSTSGQDGQQSHTKKPVEFQFCAECSNMLYPKEDEETRTLQFTCRTCHYTTNASNTCVFRNELNSSASLHAGIIEGMGKDPTVGAPVPDTCSPSAASTAAVTVAPPLSHLRQHVPAGSTIVLCLVCGKPILCAVCEVAPFYVCNKDMRSLERDADDDDAENSFFSAYASDASSPGAGVQFSWNDDSDVYDFMNDDYAESDAGSAEDDGLSRSIMMLDRVKSTSSAVATS